MRDGELSMMAESEERDSKVTRYVVDGGRGYPGPRIRIFMFRRGQICSASRERALVSRCVQSRDEVPNT